MALALAWSLGSVYSSSKDLCLIQLRPLQSALVLRICLLEHMRLGLVPAGLYAEVTYTRKISLTEEPIPVGGHCPSGDRLLKSIASVYGKDSVGVVLTGMGADGADGLLTVRDVQGITFAQDEATSVIYGMPNEARRNGAAQRILPLQDIADAICQVIA